MNLAGTQIRPRLPTHGVGPDGNETGHIAMVARGPAASNRSSVSS